MFKRLIAAWTRSVTAVERTVTAVEQLALVIENNSAKVEALAAEQKTLRNKFDVLVEHSAFLADAKKKELQRSGHHVV